jgi:NAD(P)-dependent dehydrogenase (short-subunit alcohol dehydrogenase family)
MNVLDHFRMDGKVAVVTGGAGLYGRQIVRALAEAGAQTWMASRDIGRLTEQAKAFAQEGLSVQVAEYDQGDEASILALRDRVVAESGAVDVLVNNAVLRGMTGWSGKAEDFSRSMAVNATGLFLMIRAFGDHMAQRRQGSIINIGSIQGEVGPDYSLYEGLGMDIPPDYFQHKGGMGQLTRFAASKLGPTGVRVNTLSPGGYANDQDPRFVERYHQRTLLKRMANDTDLMGAVVFLASDASAYVTGATLSVDGGYTAI